MHCYCQNFDNLGNDHSRSQNSDQTVNSQVDAIIIVVDQNIDQTVNSQVDATIIVVK